MRTCSTLVANRFNDIQAVGAANIPDTLIVSLSGTEVMIDGIYGDIFLTSRNLMSPVQELYEWVTVTEDKRLPFPKLTLDMWCLIVSGFYYKYFAFSFAETCSVAMNFKIKQIQNTKFQ